MHLVDVSEHERGTVHQSSSLHALQMEEVVAMAMYAPTEQNNRHPALESAWCQLPLTTSAAATAAVE